VIKPWNLGASVAQYFENNAPVGSPGPLVGIDGGYSSVNTPNWRNLDPRERKLTQWHPFSYERRVNNGSVMRAIATNDSPLIPSTTSWVGPITRFSAFTNVTNANGNIAFPETDAQRKALSRVQGRISAAQVNIAQAYAERKQAVDMISKRIRFLGELARSINTGNLIKAGQLLVNYGRPVHTKNVRWHSQNLANHWLEYQYGWKPLLSDIYGGCAAIFDAHYTYRPLEFSGSATVQGYIPQMILRAGPMPTSGHHWEWEARAVSYRETARYVIQVEEDTSVLHALASLGVTNPALLAWELFPYSFVADWILPVGPWLQQLEYARGLTFVRGTLSHRKKLVGATRTKYVIDSLQKGQTGIVLGGDGTYLYDLKDRTLLGSFPYQKFPSFQPQLGVERALSGISLITQLFTSGKTSRK
jgi:hypothetical protein